MVDLKKAGRLDAGWIGQDAHGQDVRVGIVAGAPGAASDLLVSGFKSALPANAEVVAEEPGMFDPGKARDVVRSMIKAHPDLDYAFAANEEMGLAVRKAFDAAGAADVKIVTVNGTDAALAALKDGRFSAPVSNSAADTRALAVTNAISLLCKDERAGRIAQARLQLVTGENADTAPLYRTADGF